jgi:EAL domain-containing protein (putative c-di-GMP-specific phosphodiesterase class I)
MAVMVELIEEAFESAAQLERYSTEQREAVHQAERQMLDDAVAPGAVAIALQPIVSVAEGLVQPRYYEALMRPRHDVLSNPLALLHAAEQQHRSVEIAGRVLDDALRAIERVPQGSGLFVNLHPEQLGAPEVLARHLYPYAEHASRITLEITERSRLQDIDRWDESIRLLGEMGFSVAVDDLGAGYSSLSILADLRPQFIKIDMSLVRGIHREPRKQRLVQLMATFGEATDSHVIAEGVEEEAEAEVLLQCGIPLLQGYYFGRPTLDALDGAAKRVGSFA